MLALALAAAVCGGPGDTLAANDRVRAYERRGAIRVCHRERRRPWRLSAADDARVAGRFVLLRRGPRLTVYDPRYRRRESGVTPVIADPEYRRIIFHRSGSVAYLATSPSGESEVGSTSAFYGIIERGYDFDTSYLRYAGSVVAWRLRDGTFRTTWVEEFRSSRPGELARSGPLSVWARDGRLTARLGRRRTALGGATSECVSAGGCSGIDGLRFAPPYVAARSNAFHLSDASGEVLVARVGDPAHRACSGEAVGEFTLAPDGGVTCSRLASQP